jgi:hypothetical protein
MKVVLAAFVASTILLPSFALADNGNHYGWYKDNGNPHYRGAPGPIAGAGLPVLAIGYGVYWLAKRRRKNTN